METIFDARIRHKYDTESNWTSRNPVLLSGEMVFSVTDSGVKIKIGDGDSHYSRLAFVTDGLVTRTEFLATLSAMNLGFAENEDDMTIDPTLQSLAEELNVVLNGGN